MKTITLEHLAFDQDIMAYCERSLSAGIAEGAFPAGRRSISGGESAAVMRVGDELIGFATYYRPLGENILWLDLLWVESRHRRRGIGSKIVCAVIAAAQRAEMPLSLGTIAGNRQMASLAESLGFEVASITYRKEPVS